MMSWIGLNILADVVFGITENLRYNNHHTRPGNSSLIKTFSEHVL